MHQRVVKAIELALTQTGRDDLLKIFVNDKETGGFWRMIVVTKKEYEHLLPHIERIGKDIGMFYGEGLGVEKGTNYIIFS